MMTYINQQFLKLLLLCAFSIVCKGIDTPCIPDSSCCSKENTLHNFMCSCICKFGWTGKHCTIEETFGPEKCPPSRNWRKLKNLNCTDTQVCSDNCCRHEKWGVIETTRKVWKAAQMGEKAEWHGKAMGQDRGDEHARGFGHYRSLPKSLGNVIEIGCGPWTQFKTITVQRPDISVSSLTLLDPNMDDYKTYSAVYANGHFKSYHWKSRPHGIKATLISAGGEELNGFKHFERYDTIIMMNVIEHVLNSVEIINNVINALKPEGLFIFHEKNMNHEKNPTFRPPCMGGIGTLHPVRVYQAFLDEIAKGFDLIYANWDGTKEMRKRNWSGIYLIGRKRASWRCGPHDGPENSNLGHIEYRDSSGHDSSGSQSRGSHFKGSFWLLLNMFWMFQSFIRALG